MCVSIVVKSAVKCLIQIHVKHLLRIRNVNVIFYQHYVMFYVVGIQIELLYKFLTSLSHGSFSKHLYLEIEKCGNLIIIISLDI